MQIDCCLEENVVRYNALNNVRVFLPFDAMYNIHEQQQPRQAQILYNLIHVSAVAFGYSDNIVSSTDKSEMFNHQLVSIVEHFTLSRQYY